MARPTDPFSQRQQTASLRRGKNGILTLPGRGYSGPVPTWPDGGEPTADEQRLWDELWASPQAAAWVGAGYDRTIARYVRLYFVGDDEPKGTILSELRQMEDRLGLSPLGLRRLGWQVGGKVSEDKLHPRGDARERARTIRRLDIEQ